jgi:murein DD-endopeptidase MepM/ murein hydrolase activator NlpD
MSKDQHEAATAFESYLIEMMVKEMRKTIPDGMFSGGQSEIFSGMFDQEISKRISETGGFGFADLMGGAMGVERQPATPSSFLPISGGKLPSVRGHAFAHGHDHDHDHHHHHDHDHGAGEMPVDGVITSRFGHRSDPFHKKKRMHRGLDIAAPTGTPIHPIQPGTVVSSGPRGGFGNVVVVDHGNGMTSLYAHCHELKVAKGDTVRPGDIIATVGSTGRSTGPHLHLEVHKDGKAVDPMSELKKTSKKPQSLVSR